MLKMCDVVMVVIQGINNEAHLPFYVILKRSIIVSLFVITVGVKQ